MLPVLPLRTRTYLLSRRGLPPFGQYQIILLCARGRYVWTTWLQGL